MKKTGVIIVLYNPDLEALSKTLDVLCPQADCICLVDNSTGSNRDALPPKDNVHYIPLGHNTGIAAAQNKGIAYLQQQECHYVLFCDQDSICPPHLLDNLKASFEALEAAHLPVAMVGPEPKSYHTDKTCYNKKGNYISHFDLKVDGNTHHFSEMHSLISSYSLTTTDILQAVGGMEEALFIDGVDNEWGWRARHRHNLKSYLDHSLSIIHFMGMPISLPVKKSPSMRLYYQYRNFIILSQRNYTPAFWIRHCRWTYLLKFFFYPVFISPRMQNAKSIIRGIRDGIRLAKTVNSQFKKR